MSGKRKLTDFGSILVSRCSPKQLKPGQNKLQQAKTISGGAFRPFKGSRPPPVGRCTGENCLWNHNLVRLAQDAATFFFGLYDAGQAQIGPNQANKQELQVKNGQHTAKRQPTFCLSRSHPWIGPPDPAGAGPGAVRYHFQRLWAVFLPVLGPGPVRIKSGRSGPADA